MENIQNEWLLFCEKVQSKISGETYLLFLKCFYNYSQEKIDKSGFENAVSALICDHPKLMEEFAHLMNILQSFSSGFSSNNVNKFTEKKTCTASHPKPVQQDGEFKKIRIDENLKIKYKREDHMHQAEMLLIWLKSAANYARDLSNGVEVESGMSRTHFERCMERLYGDEADDIFEHCGKNPRVVSAIILSRLNQKIEELSNFSAEMEKIWIDA